MGNVNVRKESGNLYIDFRHKGVRCREQTASPDTAENRKRLRALLVKIEAEIALDQFDYSKHFPDSRLARRFREPGDSSNNRPVPARAAVETVDTEQEAPLFRDFAWQWFGECKPDWKRSHAETVKGVLHKHLLPAFGDKALDDISKAEILQFRSDLVALPGRGGKTLSAQRVNHIMTPLRMILKEAADRFEFRNPYRDIKALKPNKEDIHPFSLKEVRRILATVRPDFRHYYLVRFFTGMRTAEIDGLQWRFVDFDNRQILIRETLVWGELNTTKTPESRREIDMSSAVENALREQFKVTGKQSRFVFCSPRGAPLDQGNINDRVWYPLLRHLGLAKRRPYQTRHTAATLWLGAGENPQWIARQLGHTSTEMLFRVYARYVPNLTRKDGSAMEQLLNTNGFVRDEEENL